MQQEARNTEGRNLWRPGFYLRHQTVRFVSANNLQPEEGIETETEESEKQPAKREIDPKEDISSSEIKSLEDQVSFFIDLSGEPTAHTGLSNPITTLSISESDHSSEDEIVFHGRRKLESKPLVIVETGNITKGDKSTVHVPDELESPLMFTPPTLKSKGCLNRHPNGDLSRKDSSSLEAKKAIWEVSESEEDETLADYIVNMAEHYHEDTHSLSTDTEPNELEHTIGTTSRDSPAHAATLHLTGYPEKGNGPSLEDPSDRNPNMNHQAGHVLVSPDGELEIDTIDMDTYLRDDTISASDHDLDSLQGSVDEGTVYDSDLDLEGLEALQKELQGRPTHPRRNYKDSRSTFFASTTAFADALEADPYYGLDIMDFSRPSLRKKQKGKLCGLDSVLTDSELELELEDAWRHDREKKKARKQKREELRSQGLLGRSTHGPDLKSKYSNGIGFGDLKIEIRTFLLSSKTSLALPPMTKQRRKLVHDLANALSLNSQSRGKGSSRFPILHKTSRTPRQTQKTISKIDKIFSRGRFSHGATKSWDQNATKSAKPRRGRPDSSVSYMEGDIVGGSAPEIGAENRGRAMLEKMGWSTGTALGAINNKGILSPVAHVVKNSKAGLG
ncbi:hypothetical protein BBP40_011288 [Aspergillus hancockii]|nr:hypothetical protein BBP40_011288 [Aspergillus hancockii]